MRLILLFVALAVGCSCEENPPRKQLKRIKAHLHPSEYHARLYRHVMRYKPHAIPPGTDIGNIPSERLREICKTIPAVAQKRTTETWYIINIPGDDRWAIVDNLATDMVWNEKLKGWHIKMRNEERWLPADTPHSIINHEVEIRRTKRDL